VFLNATGEAMTRAGFAYVLKRHAASAKTRCPSLCTKRTFPHLLRHTCGMVTLKATKDIRKVALWLGHNSTQTTEMYLRADPTEKLEVVSAITPPALRKGRFHAPDQLIEMLSVHRKGNDYAKEKTRETSWLGPKRRLTVHN
jgi:integrase/recombinase XerD